MWVPQQLLGLFQISKETVDSLRTELAQVRAERDELALRESVTRNNFEWLRVKVNSLEIEKTALIEKAYNIKLPAAEIVRTPVMGADAKMDEFSFNDIGEELAKQFGMVTYEQTKQ